MHMDVLPACVCLCTMCAPGACNSKKKALDPLELELQVVVSHHVGSVN